MDVKRALVCVERVPETFLKSSQAASLHKLQESTVPRLCTSRERGFGSSNSLRRSRSLYRLQHVSLHQLQQGRHRVVLAKKTQAELCKLGVCYQQNLREECSKFSSHLHVHGGGRGAIAIEPSAVNHLHVIVK